MHTGKLAELGSNEQKRRDMKLSLHTFANEFKNTAYFVKVIDICPEFIELHLLAVN